jgi:hypothetical protein
MPSAHTQPQFAGGECADGEVRRSGDVADGRVHVTGIGETIHPKATIATAVCAVALVGGNAGAAFAGEVTGNGKPTGGPAHANSMCVFSGFNER